MSKKNKNKEEVKVFKDFRKQQNFKQITLVFAATTLITIYYGVNAPLLNFGSIG